tara:strand:+ start:659 stop:1093 length:435 start_codon:yes stop_codon:yes gene_type:complete
MRRKANRRRMARGGQINRFSPFPIRPDHLPFIDSRPGKKRPIGGRRGRGGLRETRTYPGGRPSIIGQQSGGTTMGNIPHDQRIQVVNTRSAYHRGRRPHNHPHPTVARGRMGGVGTGAVRRGGRGAMGQSTGGRGGRGPMGEKI